MPNGNAEEIWNELERIQIPEGIAKKMKKFAQQPDVKIVLSLGGGGAKGCVGNFCLVYLLQKLDLMQYISEVWGTSAGSMIGSGYCAGIHPKKFLDIISTIRIRDFVSVNVRNYPEGAGYLAPDKIQELFDRILPVKTFEECIKPFFALSTRFTGESEEIVTLCQGPLSRAVTASVAIPDIFKPVMIDGNMYCDGGLIENVPNLSVYNRHRDSKDKRKLAILSTCFGKEHFHIESDGGPMSNILSILAVYRYRLQSVQNELTRMMPNTAQLMINLDVPIAKMAFNKMGPVIVPVYGQLLDKLSYICSLDNWNITY